MDRGRLLRLAGLSTGLLVAILLSAGSEPGVGPAAAMPVMAAILTAGLLAADRTVPRPANIGVRTARLVRRRTLDIVPIGPAAGVVALVVGLTGLLCITGAASTPHSFSPIASPNPDDGRHIGCISGGVTQSGPWPGWYYAIPVLTTVAVAIVVAVIALRGVVARPLTDSAAHSGETYRRRTASAIVAALGLLVAVPLAGAAYFTHSVLGQPLVCQEPVMPQTRPWLIALLIIALTAAAYYAARLVFPTPARSELRSTSMVIR
ncbi:hypothetical protein OG792_04135 [Micromonospora sp. NBC_01699]|uniref:hypothetical protein n=1 Tax=Micromonospora sp. NBC_01699 TaxID=2975984 RepID=UPI002E288102|nr:hypothetical protein [Micromonospora sp. NBC_01699]